MNYHYIGDIINTHGIKGEVRILSDIQNKDVVFNKGVNFYVGPNKDKLTVRTYRIHKNYDMVTFENIFNINDVLRFKGEKVFVKADEIAKDSYFREDLIGMLVILNGNKIATVSHVLNNNAHDILNIDGKFKGMIPLVDEFVEKVDVNNKMITVKNVEGLIYED